MVRAASPPGPLSSPDGEGESIRPPNVVLLMADQHRWDAIGAAGNPVISTPHLDRIAREGVRCAAAYVANPFCMPARVSVLTGRWPHAHGVWDNGVRCPPDTVTLATVLANHGYHTGLIGKGHLDVHFLPESPDSKTGWDDPKRAAWHGPYFGFTEAHLTCGHNLPAGHYGAWLRQEHPEAVPLMTPEHALAPPIGGAWKSALPVALHSSTWVGDRSVEFISQHADQPFFLWASFPDPHPPLCPPAPYCDLYDPRDMPLPVRQPGETADKPPHFRGAPDPQGVGRRPYGPPAVADEQRRHTDDQVRKASYYGMISLVDHNVGRILAALAEHGILDETIIVYVSDHGEMLGDHWLDGKGPWHYDGCTRIPLLFRYPRVLPSGYVLTDLVSQCDLVPTLCDLLDVPYVSWPIQSDEMHPGGVADPDTMPDVQGRSLTPALRGNGQARSQVLIEYEWRWLPGLHQKTLRTRDWRLTVYAGGQYGELYDLRHDPHEFVNRYHDPAYREARAALTADLLNDVIWTEGRLPPRVGPN